MRILYFYLMKDAPDGVWAVARDHAANWHNHRLDHYLGGPFADHSRGLITFDAESVGEAKRLVAGDPFPQRGLIERSWLKEWNVN